MVWRAAIAIALAGACAGQTPVPGKNAFDVRGKRQDIYFFRGNGQPAATVLFAPGDGGWRGFAITIAETMASWGCEVYGIDTKRYLESFTGETTLSVNDVMSDFAAISEWAGHGRPVTLVGWSEGAGLVLLAGAAEANRKKVRGVVAISLGESSVLGWRAIDNLTYITKREPNEPHFPSLPYLPKVTPLPLAMIHAEHDEYTAVDAAQRMFRSAAEPKRFWLVPADNHRFDGARDAFFRALREGIEWISQKR